MYQLTENDKKKLEYLTPIYGDRIFDLVECSVNSFKEGSTHNLPYLNTGYDNHLPVIDIFVPCRRCGELNVIKNVYYYKYLAWLAGAPIQNALTALTVDDRELMRTQTCLKCWAKLLKIEDE